MQILHHATCRTLTWVRRLTLQTRMGLQLFLHAWFNSEIYKCRIQETNNNIKFGWKTTRWDNPGHAQFISMLTKTFTKVFCKAKSKENFSSEFIAQNDHRREQVYPCGLHELISSNKILQNLKNQNFRTLFLFLIKVTLNFWIHLNTLFKMEFTKAF